MDAAGKQQTDAEAATDAPNENSAGSRAAAHAPLRDVVDYDLLFDCVHCGLCLESCPTYLLTRAEMDSPRGRIYLMKGLAEGRLKLDDDVVRHLDLCLGCRGCETACPSGVHYGRLIERARGFVEKNHARRLGDAIRRAIIRAIFPYPGRLRVMLWPLRIADRLNLRKPLLALMPRGLRNWVELVPDTAHPSALRPAPAEPIADGPLALVHHGCVAQVLTPSENLNSERALANAGYQVVRLENIVCCGALDLHDGNLARGLQFARTNVRMLRRSGAEAIVSAASGCAAAIASYGELLKDDPELASAAREVSARATDLSSLLLKRGAGSGRLDCTVTYHDSCHLAHGMGIREAPRRLLGSIPGVRLVEMAEPDLCCGSAGNYNLVESAMARRLAQRKADNIEATGADYVILGNPGCEFQIAAELKRRGSRVRVAHLADFLALTAQYNR